VNTRLMGYLFFFARPGGSFENVAWIVWFAPMPEKVYEPGLPTEEPSTITLWTPEPLFGVKVNVWLPPPLTPTDPDGEMDPPEPAEAEMEYV
jgi:hypothetical protein